MKIGVLTSSRADYGIYKPLLKELSLDSDIDLHILVFGMHVMKKFGLSIDEIKSDDFGTLHELSGLVDKDDVKSISESYAKVCQNFGSFYEGHKFDLVLALGDRFEMSAAVQAGIPFNVNFAHIHAGETTLGAIDNIYRHQISLASEILFTSTEEYAEIGKQYAKDKNKVHCVGALSLDGIDDLIFDDEEVFKNTFKIPMKDFALVTFHSETVQFEKNNFFAQQMFEALGKISQDIHCVISMPNADTMGSIYRGKILELAKSSPKSITIVENFGKRHYFNAMHYSKFLIGNSSSGILEAASFNKYVLNVGDRQKGRAQSQNVLNVPFEVDKIVKGARKLLSTGTFDGENIYFCESSAEKIRNIIKERT